MWSDTLMFITRLTNPENIDSKEEVCKPEGRHKLMPRSEAKWPSNACYFLGGRFLTSSSLHACSMILFGIPGVMPECPFDQSYETPYAKIDPVRLNAVATIGPDAASKAIESRIDVKVDFINASDLLFSRVLASLSQKWIVPSEPNERWVLASKPLRCCALTAGRECALYRVKRYVIHCINQWLVFKLRILIFTVAFKREIISRTIMQSVRALITRSLRTQNPCHRCTWSLWMKCRNVWK